MVANYFLFVTKYSELGVNRQTETDRQIQTHTETQTDTQTQTDRQRRTGRDGRTDTQTDKLTSFSPSSE